MKNIKQTDENNHPMISVIVPVFNTDKYVGECLESIISSSFNDFEIICVDGGSSDDSRNIVRQYCEKDRRIRLLEESCTSTGAARNVGVNVAEGKYIAFVDSDDYIEKNMLEILIHKAETEQAEIVCFPCCLYNSIIDQMIEGEFWLSKWIASGKEVLTPESLGEEIFQLTGNYAVSRLYRLDFLRSNQLSFQEGFCFDDLYFNWMSLAKAEIITWIQDPLYIHRIRPRSKNIYSWRYSASLLNAIVESYRELSKIYADDAAFKSLGKAAATIFFDYMQGTSQPEARQNILRALNEPRFDRFHAFLDDPGTLPAFYCERVESIKGALTHYGKLTDTIDYSIKPLISETDEKEPLISVIIPVYQAEPYLKETLDSVLGQSMRDLEIICIDDGSTDNSLNILLELAALDGRVKVYSRAYLGENAASRNFGVEHARGEYIYFLDADDLLAPFAFERILRQVEENQLDVLYFDGEAFYDEDCTDEEMKFRPNYHRYFEYPQCTSGQKLFTEFSRNSEFLVNVGLGFYRHSFLKEKNISFFSRIIHEDNLFTYLVMMEAEKTGFLPESLYRRRIHPGSIMTSRKTFRNAWGYFIVANEVSRYFRNKASKMDPETAFYSQNYIMQTIQLSRSNWELLDEFEKGKAMALGDEYPLFRAITSDPANVSLQRQRAEQACQNLENQRKTLQERNNNLLNEINSGKQREKNLSSAIKKSEAAWKSEIQKKDQSIESLKSYLNEVYNSMSCKVGNTLIQPFHFLKKLF